MVALFCISLAIFCWLPSFLGRCLVTSKPYCLASVSPSLLCYQQLVWLAAMGHCSLFLAAASSGHPALALLPLLQHTYGSYYVAAATLSLHLSFVCCLVGCWTCVCLAAVQFTLLTLFKAFVNWTHFTVEVVDVFALLHCVRLSYSLYCWCFVTVLTRCMCAVLGKSQSSARWHLPPV